MFDKNSNNKDTKPTIFKNKVVSFETKISNLYKLMWALVAICLLSVIFFYSLASQAVHEANNRPAQILSENFAPVNTTQLPKDFTPPKFGVQNFINEILDNCHTENKHEFDQDISKCHNLWVGPRADIALKTGKTAQRKKDITTKPIYQSYLTMIDFESVTYPQVYEVENPVMLDLGNEYYEPKWKFVVTGEKLYKLYDNIMDAKSQIKRFFVHQGFIAKTNYAANSSWGMLLIFDEFKEFKTKESAKAMLNSLLKKSKIKQRPKN